MSQWFRSYFSTQNKYLFLSLFLTFFGVNRWLGSRNFAITDYDHMIQGIATFSDVDINKRLATFYIGILIIAGVFAVSMVVTFFLDRKLGKLNHLIVPWNKLAAFGCFFLFFKLTQCNQPFSFTFLFPVFLTLLFYQIARYVFRGRLLGVTSVTFVWLSLLSFSFCFLEREALQIFTGLKVFRLAVLYPASFLGLLCFLVVLSRWSSWKFKRIFLASLPFFTLPLLSVLSDEFYLILNQRGLSILSPDVFYGIGLLICLSISLRLFFWAKKRKVKDYFKIYIYPTVLIGIIIFTQYKPIIDHPKEMFELANPANAIMRLLEFHELPVIQALGSHVLSDIGTNLVYTAMNGYNGNVDFVIYDFIINAVFLLIFYFFFLRIFKDGLFVFLFALFFPFLLFAVLDHHTLVFATILLMIRLFEKYSFGRLLGVVLWSVFLLLWKIEVGVSSMVATAVLTGFYLVTDFRKEMLRDLLKIVGALVCMALVMVLLMTFVCHIDVWGNLFQAKEYFGANQAHGYYDIANYHDRFYQYHYFIFPIISLFLFLFLLVKSRKERTGNTLFLYLSLLFLVVYYFVQAQRGLVRHSLLEGKDLFMSSYFFLILSFFIYFVTIRHTYAKYIFICVFVFMIHNFEYQGTNGYVNQFEELSMAFRSRLQVKASDHKVERVRDNEGFAKENYLDFKHFMDTWFEKDATFIDLSNTPMLYFYTHRRVPAYFNQYMQNMVTEYLQVKNIAYLKKWDVPVAVFSYDTELWWDNTDGVPNTIRYNQIARYIYRNYEPLTVLNHHYVWIKKGITLPFPDSLRVDSLFVNAAKTYDLKKYPYLLAKSKKLLSDTVVYKTWIPVDSMFSLKGLNPVERFDNYLKINMSSLSDHNENMIVRYSNNGTILGSFQITVIPSLEQQSYVIPLSSQYNWIRHHVDCITLSNHAKDKVVVGEVSLFAQKTHNENHN